MTSSSGSAVGHAHDLTPAEREWLKVRTYLQQHRHALAVDAASEFPGTWRVATTPLVAHPAWFPDQPILLDQVQLTLDLGAPFEGVTGVGDTAGELPGPDYRSYADGVRLLDRPRLFEDRPTYRLLSADLAGDKPLLTFGHGSYFDSINTGEAAAHEYVARRLGTIADDVSGMRQAIGDPRDLTRRPANLAISTLTIRKDTDSTYLVHWRDPAKVGHAGGLYQAVPVGIFQPSAAGTSHQTNDFSLWHNIVREYWEELCGGSEDYGPNPVNYETWEFAQLLSAGVTDGSIKPYCLGLGVDPLTFATDLLTAIVFEASVYDEIFTDGSRNNTEGRVLDAQPYSRRAINDFLDRHDMQAAGAALLRLAIDRV